MTHCYHGNEGGILDANRRVFPEVFEARERGSSSDVGHGIGSFTWRVARAALAQGLPPTTISSDVHAYNVEGPVFDQPTTLSKLLALGMPPRGGARNDERVGGGHRAGGPTRVTCTRPRGRHHRSRAGLRIVSPDRRCAGERFCRRDARPALGRACHGRSSSPLSETPLLAPEPSPGSGFRVQARDAESKARVELAPSSGIVDRSALAWLDVGG